MAWIRDGVVNVTFNTKVVAGVGTSWVSEMSAGGGFNAPDGRVYEIASIDTDTQLTLVDLYKGTTASAQAYSIVPTQAYMLTLANQATALVNTYAAIVAGAGAGNFAPGTATTPSVRGSTDPDTGVNMPGGNVLNLGTAGVTQLSIDAAGNPTGPVFPKMSVSAIGAFDSGAMRYAVHPLANSSASRGSFQAPNLYQNGVTWEFKGAESLGGLSGQFGGALTLAPFIGTAASTGGPQHQLGFRNDGVMLYRTGIDTTWNIWETVLTDRFASIGRATIDISTANFDALIAPGVAAAIPGAASPATAVNPPPLAQIGTGYGFFESLVNNNGLSFIQRYYPDGRQAPVLLRSKWLNNAWTPWTREYENATGDFDVTRNVTVGQDATIARKAIAQRFHGALSLSTTALNTGAPIAGTNQLCGILILRDNTNGGTGLYVMDPNTGVVTVSALGGVGVSISGASDGYRWYITTLSGTGARSFSATIVSPSP